MMQYKLPYTVTKVMFKKFLSITAIKELHKLLIYYRHILFCIVISIEIYLMYNILMSKYSFPEILIHNIRIICSINTIDYEL